jgi:hypothetical protein
MPRPFRVGLLLLLGLLGLGGLLRLQILPPPLARVGRDDTFTRLEARESLLEVRQQAATLLTLFVGGEITRHYWGGFTPYFDVLGMEVPPSFETDLTVSEDRVRLSLRPRRQVEQYLAEVRLFENMPRGTACRGHGTPGAFREQGRRLVCPKGWTPLQDPLVRQDAVSP